MLDDIDPTAVADPLARALIMRLLNVVNDQAAQLQAQAAEIQALRDEINRLKGEQGRPQIKPPRPARSAPLSSETERRTPTPRHGRPKQAELTITREEVCRLDRARLPPDVQFKGYEEVLVQDLRIEAETIRFRKEKFYSPSLGQTFLAPLPAGYDGQFGPELRSFVLSQYFGANVSQPALRRLLGFFGIAVSSGQLSNILTAQGTDFQAESSAVLAAGLESSFYQHLDATSTRVGGQNYACHVLASPAYTAYRTTAGADRLNVLRALTDGQPLGYLWNARVRTYLQEAGLAAKWLVKLADWPLDQVLRDAELNARLAEGAWTGLPVSAAKLLREGLALGAYHAQQAWPPVRVLVVDDAPTWAQLSAETQLCWIHEGRHYKKLVPLVAHFRQVQARFLGRFWRYYRQLAEYPAAPSAERAAWLRRKFRRLFSTVTGYGALDAVIARTKGKQEQLLLVLKYPKLPLHNNAAEQGARVRVRKRDVSFGPRSLAGLKAWDTFMTLVETTRKVGVNFHAYVRDRLRGLRAIAPLADLVRQKAAALNLTLA